MHSHSIAPWQHEHFFLSKEHERRERRTWAVVVLTLVMMVAEIVGGTIYGSIAVVADGWHMSTHAAALGIAALAYRFARKHALDPHFSFGTGKLGELAAFASAVLLALISLLIAYESLIRLYSPVAIRFDEAILLAVVGLGVNLLSAWLLFERDHPHERHHEHGAGHHHHHEDTNIRAAYSHVLADALTSVLAIVALLGGRFMGWIWLDPVIGVVGAIVIARWSWGLIRDAGAVLLDTVPDESLAKTIREKLEQNGDRVADLHLWRVGPGHSALIVAIVADRPQSPRVYKDRLASLRGLSHITIEVHPCLEHVPAPLT